MHSKKTAFPSAVALASALLVIGCGGGGSPSHSPGSIDAGFDPGSGIGNWVNCIAVQPDGKILAGGGQYESDGIPASGALARLNENGSADGTFIEWTGVDAKIECLALQEDGKILIGGQFTSVNGAPMNRIARLDADGGLDEEFAIGEGANGGVRAILVNADGTIMIGGGFTTYDGAAAPYFARLNEDGSLDETYHPAGSGFGNVLMCLAAAPGGGYFAAGSFSSYDGVARARLAKLGADGTLDEDFVPAAIDSGSIYGIAPRPDGSVVIAGSFTSVGGVSRPRIARLTSAGALDASFDPGTGVQGNNSAAYGLTMQPDGKVLIGGYYNSYDGVPHNGGTRIEADGSLDASFVTDPSWREGVDTKLCFAIQGDGKILMGGNFSICGGTSRRYIARVWP